MSPSGQAVAAQGPPGPVVKSSRRSCRWQELELLIGTLQSDQGEHSSGESSTCSAPRVPPSHTTTSDSTVSSGRICSGTKRLPGTGGSHVPLPRSADIHRDFRCLRHGQMIPASHSDLFPVSEMLLCYFVASLMQESIAPATILTDLADVQHAKIMRGHPEPHESSSLPLLRLVQNGVMRECVG